jgi:hypothetical protein
LSGGVIEIKFYYIIIIWKKKIKKKKNVGREAVIDWRFGEFPLLSADSN